MTQPTGQSNSKDFSKRREPVTFTIDDDTFLVRRSIPVEGLQQVQKLLRDGATQGEGATLEELMPRFKRVIQILLDTPSGTRFVQRMGDWDNPIDLEQVRDVVEWVTSKVAGDRPTTPSSDSSSGFPSDGAGTSSADGASFAESLPSN